MKPTDEILKAAIAAHRSNELLEAKTLYEEALLHEPHRPEILFNLGTVLIALRQMEQAAYCYESVLKIDPDHIAAHYYLANCYFSLEKFPQAQQHYEKVLNYNPGHVDALNNLGALLLHQKNYEQALQCFSAILTGHPRHSEARNNLAATLMQMQRYYHAAEHFRLLLEQNPTDKSVLYSYALALLDSGDFVEAIKQFENLLQLHPEHIDAQSNLGIAYLKSGELIKAKEIFAKVLQQQPNNIEIDFLYRAVSGNPPPPSAPAVYVKNLFDHYAKHYEQHVVDVLHYQVPKQLLALLEKTLGSLPDRHWDVLDLGCGTGLSGLEFRSLALHLHGVDLSARMLALAKDKLLYDELFEADLIELLQKKPHAYDLLLAADTFNYFGDFTLLLQACRQALKPSGWLLFSAEAEANTPTWELQNNGRYAHHEDYLITQAKQHGFEIVALESAILREQDKQAVNGWLCLMKGVH